MKKLNAIDFALCPVTDLRHAVDEINDHRHVQEMIRLAAKRARICYQLQRERKAAQGT